MCSLAKSDCLFRSSPQNTTSLMDPINSTEYACCVTFKLWTAVSPDNLNGFTDIGNYSICQDESSKTNYRGPHQKYLIDNGKIQQRQQDGSWATTGFTSCTFSGVSTNVTCRDLKSAIG